MADCRAAKQQIRDVERALPYAEPRYRPTSPYFPVEVGVTRRQTLLVIMLQLFLVFWGNWLRKENGLLRPARLGAIPISRGYTLDPLETITNLKFSRISTPLKVFLHKQLIENRVVSRDFTRL